MAEISLAGIHLSILVFGGLAVGAWIILGFGHFLLRLAGAEKNLASELGLELIIGIAATNLIVIGIINLVSVSSGRAFVLFVAGFSAILLFLNYQKYNFRPVKFRGNFSKLDRGSYTEIFHLVILCVVVLAWARLQAGAFPSLQHSGTAKIWVDYFIHGREIAQYSRVDGLARGDALLVGEPVKMYHRAIFALPAAISQLAQLPAFVAATALLLPLGLLVCLMGVSTLTSTLAKNRMTGLLAALLLIVLPDASSYGLHNGAFSVSWLTFTHPGTGWALGICAISLAILCSWLRTGGKGLFILAAMLALSVLWHRAHLFILFAPAFVLLVFVASRYYQLVKRGALLFIAVCVVGWIWTATRSMWLKYSAVNEFMRIIHNTEPSAYTGWYAHFIGQYGVGVGVPVGVVLVLMAAFGLLLLIFPILYWLKRHQFGLETIDVFPLFLMAAFIAVVLFAPVAGYNHDPTEYQFRGFVLPYAVTLSYCVAYASLLLGRYSDSFTFSPAVVNIGLPALLIVGGAALLWNDDPSKPRWEQGARFYPSRITNSLLSTGEYLREHSGESGVFAVVPTQPDAIYVDIPSALVSLSGSSAFLACAGFEKLLARSVVEERIDILNKVAMLSSQEDAFELLRRHGISWLVTAKSGILAWDKEGARANFSESSLSVYQVK